MNTVKQVPPTFPPRRKCWPEAYLSTGGVRRRGLWRSRAGRLAIEAELHHVASQNNIWSELSLQKCLSATRVTVTMRNDSGRS
jgi:hypothetical protein